MHKVFKLFQNIRSNYIKSYNRRKRPGHVFYMTILVTLLRLYGTVPFKCENKIHYKDMWLGTKVCVQWRAKLETFESKSVDIAFL